MFSAIQLRALAKTLEGHIFEISFTDSLEKPPWILNLILSFSFIISPKTFTVITPASINTSSRLIFLKVELTLALTRKLFTDRGLLYSSGTIMLPLPPSIFKAISCIRNSGENENSIKPDNGRLYLLRKPNL